MTILGAVLAGGGSRRYGSDKALALTGGRTMLDAVAGALAAQADAVVVCGGERAGIAALPDRPQPGLGPLGGLNAALAHAAALGHDRVLAAPVDTYPLPPDLLRRLGPAPAAFASQYLIGIWPVALQGALERYLAGGGRAVRGWLEASGCRLVDEGDLVLRNRNTPGD